MTNRDYVKQNMNDSILATLFIDQISMYQGRGIIIPVYRVMPTKQIYNTLYDACDAFYKWLEEEHKETNDENTKT